MDIDIKNNMNKDNQLVLSTICLRGIVMFPGMVLHFDVGRKKSIEAINNAMLRDRTVFLIAQKDINSDSPTLKDLYSVGTVSKIKNMLKNSDGSVRILVEGLFKANLMDIYSDDPYYECFISKINDVDDNSIDEIGVELEALLRVLKSTFSNYGSISPRISKEIVATILSEEDPKVLFDLIVQSIVINYKDKQRLLEQFNYIDKIKLLIEIINKEMLMAKYEIDIYEQVKERVDKSQRNYFLREQINYIDKIKLLIEIINKEMLMAKYEIDIYEQVKERVDKSQRNYFLREQMKVISNELGEGESTEQEIDDYIEKINKIKNISKDAKEKLLKESYRLKKMIPSSHEANILRMYIETCLELPWDVKTKSKIDLDKAETILNNDHYGLKKIKERILEFISVRKLAPNIKGQIICLVGPPGVGKTSISKSIASSIGRKCVRVSLGGVRDEADIRGHRKTYVGAMPGRIISAIKQAKTKNPVIILDEIDKMGMDFKGDPSSAMLEVLDVEQNFEFRDHYIEVDFDISDVIFICTANSMEAIPAPLADRMEIITLTSYTRDEKFNIAKNHLIKKQMKLHGLNTNNLQIDDEVIYKLIDNYTRESGVRKLERAIASLCRKSAKIIVRDNKEKINIDIETLRNMIGSEKYKIELFGDKFEVGVSNGLAWTSVGGDILQIEVSVVEGKGKLELTGNLGNVMQESAKTAVSLTRNLYKDYGIDSDFYKNKDIHIHVPEGAIPKDGPSAGITITTAVISALSNIPIKCSVAMTGEVSLRGRVLAIGGLKEKTMAAHRSGIKTVIIPKDNYHNLEEIDDVVRESIEFIPVENIKEVLDIAFVKKDHI